MKTIFLFLIMFFIWHTSNCQMLEVKRGDYQLDEKKEKKIADTTSKEKTEEEKVAEEKSLNEDLTMKGLGNFTFNGRKVIPNIQILADRVSRSNSNSTAR